MSTREEGLARSRRVTGALVTASVLGVGGIAVVEWSAHAAGAGTSAAATAGTTVTGSASGGTTATGTTQSPAGAGVSSGTGGQSHAVSGGS